MFKQIYSILGMGSYGWYVWPCYVLLILVFSAHIYLAVRAQRKLVVKFREKNDQHS